MARQPLLEITIQYLELVETLAKSQEISAGQVLPCLVSRDKIAFLLAKDGPAEVEAAGLIAKGDCQLRKFAQAIGQLPELDGWRQSFTPPAEAWWWPQPFQPPPGPPGFFDRFNWLWTALALVLLTLSLSLIADISTRFLSGDTDAYGVLAVVAPTILTLFTTRSVLTQGGQEAIRRILDSFKFVPAQWREELGFGVSVLLLLSLTLFWFSLPQIAHSYNDSGLEKYYAGEFAGARADFERALKLAPNLLETHYNLGVLYEDLNDYKQAQAEYQLAVQGTHLDAAYNNLARLYILDKAYDLAVPLLTTLKAQNLAQDDKVRYDVNKNLGWARLGQGRYDEAVQPLEEAIQMAPERASAHCLLAQVLQTQAADQARVEAAWLNCLNYADQTNPDEDRWLGLARQYFAAQEPQRGAE